MLPLASSWYALLLNCWRFLNFFRNYVFRNMCLNRLYQSSCFLEEHFKDCYYNISGFDACVREGLNSIQSYFKTGLPQYNVLPFDPFFAPEIIATRGMPNFGFTLTLRNVTETGWSTSKVTKFVSDLNNHKVNTLMPCIVIIMTLHYIEVTCKFCQWMPYHLSHFCVLI